MNFFQHIRIVIIITTCTLSTCIQIRAAEIYAKTAETFFLQPDQPGTIKLETRGLAVGKELEYSLHDVSGQKLTTGKTMTSNAGSIELKLCLSAGYYEVFFPTISRLIGVICLNDLAGPKDPFFGMDAGLSWSRWTKEYKQTMIDVLTGKGIAIFRERFNWVSINPTTGNFDIYGQVRKDVYSKHGRCLLELFHHAPPSVRPNGKIPFPQNMIKTRDDWSRIARAVGKDWRAFEEWNEPNCTPLPGDQYVPLAKTVTAALAGESNTVQVTIVGGCFNPSVSAAYLESCSDNGLLEVVDAISFHIYGPPESMIPAMQFYRAWLKKAGRENLPLWISEAGFPWMANPSRRPLLGEGKVAAVAITMRGIEAKACGAVRYFPFYLQAHDEGTIGWGMTDGIGSPLPSLAAWLFATQKLNNKKYIGDLVLADRNIRLARVFADADETVAVIYGSPGIKLKMPLPVLAASGFDGRILKASGNIIELQDGMVYIKLPAQNLSGFLKKDTEAMKLYQKNGKEPIVKTIKRVVVQPLLPTAVAMTTCNGYMLTRGQAEKYSLTVNFANLDNRDIDAKVRLTLPQGTVLISGTETTKVKLPTCKTTPCSWTLNLNKLFQNGGAPVKVLITATDEHGTELDHAAMTLSLQPPRETYSVMKAARRIKLDGSTEPEEWSNAYTVDSFKCYSDTSHGNQLQVPPEELSAKAAFLWNDYGLNFLVTVTDKMHVQNQTPALSWKQDSLQISLYQLNSSVDCNRFEWGFFLAPEGARHVTFSTSTGKPLSEASKIAITRNKVTHQTIYEGLLSWADLGSMNAINTKEGMRFRLSFAVNDSNGGERRWLEWSPGIAGSKNPDEFPELVLCSQRETVLFHDDFSRGGPATERGWQRHETAGPSAWSIVTENGIPWLQIKEKKDAKLSLRLPPLKSSPIEVSFRLKVKKNTGRGFNLSLLLRNSSSREGYAMWAASSDMFAGKSGFAIIDSNRDVIAIGKEKSHLPSNGSTCKLSFRFDPGSQSLKLFADFGNGKQLIASGTGKRMISQIDTLELSTSDWGAAPRLLSGLTVSGTAP